MISKSCAVISRPFVAMTFSLWLCLSLDAPFACAVITTADPDASSDGSDISNLFPGVILSASGSDTTGPEVFATSVGTPSTGTLLFGHTGNSLWGRNLDLTNSAMMRVDFAAPTNFVSIDAISNLNDQNGDFAEMVAFNAGGTQVGLDTVAIPPAGTMTLTVSLGAGVNDISYVEITNPTSNPSESFHLDHLRFDLVPEPSSLSLLGLAVIGALIIRRGRGRAL